MIHPPATSTTRRILAAANRYVIRTGDLPQFKRTFGTAWLIREPQAADPQP